MNNTRWQVLERLFEEGLELPEPARDAWLAGQAVDTSLRDELRELFAIEPEARGIAGRFDAALAEALDLPRPGLRLGPWRLLRELGSGGMGHVFLAERADEQFRQQVAIKLIRGQCGPLAAKQLRHERQVLAELVHPNIARLLDGGETPGGQPYLVMEYVSGEPVTRAARRRGLPRDRRVALVRDLAHAVHHAHRHLVVHRDIKPANVLLREDGQPMLLDFGIAKLLDGETRAAEPTQRWFTPAYASPEQRAGRPMSTATDVYALGLLLYELLTEQAPAPDAEGALAPQRRLLGEELDRIVQRATAVDPTRRYTSAEALADDLQRFLGGEPVRAMPDSLAYRIGKQVRRRPFTTLLATAAMAMLALFAWRLADERDRAVHAEASARQAQAQAQRETQAAEGVTAYLVDLFRAADPEQARGTSLTPSQLIDRGAERLERAGVSGPQRVRLLGAFGEIYVNLGHPEKASHVLESALTGSEPLSTTMRAQLSMAAARAADARRRFDDTERYFREAVALWREAGDARQLADALDGLAIANTRLQRNAQAEAAMRESLRIVTQLDGEDAPVTLLARVSLAEVLFNAGQREDARALMDPSIARLRQLLPPHDSGLISALGFYATMLRDSGETDAAIAVFLEILAQRQAVLEHDSQRLALVLNNLGRTYYDRGETLKAIEQFRAVYEIGARDGAENDPSRALDMLNLASLYEEVGDYEQALPLMRQGTAIVDGNPSAAHLLGTAHQNLGRLLMLSGQAQEAREWLEKPLLPGSGPSQADERARQCVHLADWNRRYGDLDEAESWLQRAEASIADFGGAESPRMAAIERVRAQVRRARGDVAGAQRGFEASSAHLVKARNARYIGVGDLALELADLALTQGETDRARRELARAVAILDPQLAPNAPQRKRWAALQAKL